MWCPCWPYDVFSWPLNSEVLIVGRLLWPVCLPLRWDQAYIWSLPWPLSMINLIGCWLLWWPLSPWLPVPHTLPPLHLFIWLTLLLVIWSKQLFCLSRPFICDGEAKRRSSLGYPVSPNHLLSCPLTQASWREDCLMFIPLRRLIKPDISIYISILSDR